MQFLAYIVVLLVSVSTILLELHWLTSRRRSRNRRFRQGRSAPVPRPKIEGPNAELSPVYPKQADAPRPVEAAAPQAVAPARSRQPRRPNRAASGGRDLPPSLSPSLRSPNSNPCRHRRKSLRPRPPARRRRRNARRNRPSAARSSRRPSQPIRSPLSGRRSPLRRPRNSPCCGDPQTSVTLRSAPAPTIVPRLRTAPIISTGVARARRLREIA